MLHGIGSPILRVFDSGLFRDKTKSTLMHKSNPNTTLENSAKRSLKSSRDRRIWLRSSRLQSDGGHAYAGVQVHLP